MNLIFVYCKLKKKNVLKKDSIYIHVCNLSSVVVLPSLKCSSNDENCFKKGRKHCAKRRKSWLSAFSPSTIKFSTDVQCLFYDSKRGGGG